MISDIFTSEPPQWLDFIQASVIFTKSKSPALKLPAKPPEIVFFCHLVSLKLCTMTSSFVFKTCFMVHWPGVLNQPVNHTKTHTLAVNCHKLPQLSVTFHKIKSWNLHFCFPWLCYREWDFLKFLGDLWMMFFIPPPNPCFWAGPSQKCRLAKWRLEAWNVALGIDRGFRQQFLEVEKPTKWMWVFPKIGWFIMEIPIKMDDLGYPYFRNIHVVVLEMIFGARTHHMFFNFLPVFFVFETNIEKPNNPPPWLVNKKNLPLQPWPKFLLRYQTDEKNTRTSNIVFIFHLWQHEAILQTDSVWARASCPLFGNYSVPQNEPQNKWISSRPFIVGSLVYRIVPPS